MNIPEGYVLVPINATSAMIEHGKDERMQCLANPSFSVQVALVRIYSAMIGAAPFVCESNVEEYEEAKEREPFSEAMVELGRCNHVNAVLSDDDFYHFKSDWEVWKACAKSRARSAE